MTVFVTNYSAGNPKEGVRIDTGCVGASSWHRKLDPRNIGPVEFMGVEFVSVDLACKRCRLALPSGHKLNRAQYRLQVLGRLYAGAIVQTDAFTKLCEIYDRDERLVLRDRDATPWSPKLCSLEAHVYNAEGFTHSHILAAMLMNDKIVQYFEEVLC